MADMMMFPKTVDEFMEKYKIVDSDEVYTNGAELVPIFRMKQWFEHMDVEPVKHGHWEYIGGYGYQYRCSECIMCVEHTSNYCPHCGAKMDET